MTIITDINHSCFFSLFSYSACFMKSGRSSFLFSSKMLVTSNFSSTSSSPSTLPLMIRLSPSVTLPRALLSLPPIHKDMACPGSGVSSLSLAPVTSSSPPHPWHRVNYSLLGNYTCVPRESPRQPAARKK